MTIKINNSMSQPIADLRYLKQDQTTPQTITAADTDITATDEIYYGDVTDSTKIKKDTVQGILDLVPAPDLSGYLALDQTTPQAIINGTPNFEEGLLSDDTGTFDFNTGTFGVPVKNGLHTTTTSDAGGFNVVSVNQINATDILTMSTAGGLGFLNYIDGGASYYGPSIVYGVFGFNSLYNGGYTSGMVGGEFQSNIRDASIADMAMGIVGSVTVYADSAIETAYGSKIGITASGTDAVIGTAYGYYADLFSGNGGVTTNAYGYYATDVNKAINNYAIYTNLGDVSFGDDLILRNDNDKIWFGTGKDASVYYNGTNLVINPKEVGTGYLDLRGVLRTTHDDYNLFGDTTGMNATILPLTGRDRLYSAISSAATSGNIRAGFFAGNFSGASSSSLNVNGVNAFANTLSSSTGDLTATNMGGGLRSRYAIRHDGKGTVALASTITANIQANGGNITKGSLFNAETPTVQVGKTIGDLAGFRVTGGAVAGIITTRYGLKVDSLLGGTTRWGVYVDADDSFFGGKVAFTQTDGNEYIDSLADGYMDYGATTAHRFSGPIHAVHKAADGTAAVADGTYTVGLGTTTNGTITIKDGIITAIQEAS